MAKKRPTLPTLPETGRSYLAETARARLRSPGLERYARPSRSGAWIALAVVVVLALAAAVYWLR
jgi:hypothetical protein